MISYKDNKEAEVAAAKWIPISVAAVLVAIIVSTSNSGYYQFREIQERLRFDLINRQLDTVRGIAPIDTKTTIEQE